MDGTVVKSAPQIGEACEGGTFVGRIAIDGVLYGIVVAPKSLGEHAPTPWSAKRKSVEGARSYCDGLANTQAMAASGSKLAQWALAIDDGQWYLPSRDELELCYRYLKPGTYTENAWRHGDNPSSVPPGYPYTTDTVQASVAAFRTGGDDAFAEEWYWTSTQSSHAEYAWAQHFYYGGQYDDRKGGELRARAVRRFRI